MKHHISAAALIFGLGLAGPSYALDLTGSYLAQFAVANGDQKPVCFALTSTGAKQNYRDTGMVTSTTYPNYSGYYVVFKQGFHLTFLNGDKPSVTITGSISKGHLVNSSATEFKTSGEINNVGTLTENKSCAAD